GEMSKERKQNVPFCRVREDEVIFHDDRLKDNTWESKGGSDNYSYGFRANQDLIVTKGKSFRTEKNKKKRGSYRGGAIDFASHSIKFNLDD
ncbi:SRP40, C-terminal domain-containing protein, partial [Piptocephalis cylindrospora]